MSETPERTSSTHDLDEVFELLRIAERAGARMGVREGCHVPMQRTAEQAEFFEALAAGRYRKARHAVRDLGAALADQKAEYEKLQKLVGVLADEIDDGER